MFVDLFPQSARQRRQGLGQNPRPVFQGRKAVRQDRNQAPRPRRSLLPQVETKGAGVLANLQQHTVWAPTQSHCDAGLVRSGSIVAIIRGGQLAVDPEPKCPRCSKRQIHAGFAASLQEGQRIGNGFTIGADRGREIDVVVEGPQVDFSPTSRMSLCGIGRFEIQAGLGSEIDATAALALIVESTEHVIVMNVAERLYQTRLPWLADLGHARHPPKTSAPSYE